MTHFMNLKAGPFSMIACGQKTIELRLYDEKRQTINVGDTILFAHTDDPTQTLSVRVEKLHIFPSFRELYQTLPLQKCGYLPQEIATASPDDMLMYYPAEKQNRYGVVGIEISL